MRIATLNPELFRAGPGLLLKDILGREDPQIEAARDLIASANPDILLLTSFDFDLDLIALLAFRDLLRDAGTEYVHVFARRPNTGIVTGLDLDGDGYRGGPGDALGYGEFAGQGGLALLSKFPIDIEAVRDFSALPWSNLPGANLPLWPAHEDNDEARSTLPLVSAAAWDVPVKIGCGLLHLFAYRANTPAFDGPEDRNGLRNRDENLFWLRYLDGDLPWTAPSEPFILLGDSNLDPSDGDGFSAVMQMLLEDGRLQDPKPANERGRRATRAQAGVNRIQQGDPTLDTADWQDRDGPGNLRVDYVLPSAGLKVLDAGMFWADEAAPDLSRGPDRNGLRHALVWVDIGWQAGGECVD